MVNREFASKILGSVPDAVGRYFKLRDGTRVRVVGLVEDGKYVNLTEGQTARDVPPPPAVAGQLDMAGGALEPRPAGTCRGHEKCAPGHRPWDGSGDSPVEHRTGRNFVPLAHGDSIAGCAGRDGRHAVDYRHLRNGGVLGEQAAARSWEFAWLSARSARKCCRPRWDVRSNCWRLVRGLDWFWVCLATKVLAFIVYQATPRDPLVLAGVVLAMLLLGLVATWIPAQRALSVNPLILLREE